MRLKRVFYGWWIILAASVMHFWAAGMFFYAFTAFFKPLVQEFHWSYAATAFAASFRSLEGGIASPVVGFLTDRHGPRKLMLTGGILAGMAAILLSRINSLGSFYAAYIFLSIGVSLVQPLPGWTAVANWFSRKRSTAMGILLAGSGLSGVLVTLANRLITEYGWRTAFVIAGFATWAIVIPLSLVVRHRPEPYGLFPDGAKGPPEEQRPEARQAHARHTGVRAGLTVRQAVRMRPFWMLAVVATVSSAATHAVTIHVMPYLDGVGLPRETAGFVAAGVAVSSIAGRVGFGWLGDRVDKRYLLIASLLLQAFGLLVFVQTRTLAQAVLFLALFGPGFGGVTTLKLSTMADYFGVKSFGSIEGLLQGIHVVGTFLSPVLVGLAFDVWGSYQSSWLVLAALVALSIPIILVTRPAAKTAHVAAADKV